MNSLTEKDMVLDLLKDLKCLLNALHTFNEEASCINVFDDVKSVYDNVLSMQRDVFTYAHDNSFYQVKEETKTNIDTTCSTLSKYIENN